MSFWGWQFMIDCNNCNTNLITDENNIKNFVKELTTKLLLESYGDLFLIYLVSDEINTGYNFIQLLKTGKISGTFVTSLNSAYIDVISTKRYDTHPPEDLAKEFFKCDQIRINFLTRSINDHG